MGQSRKVTLCVAVGMVLPFISKAGGLADDMHGMQSVLAQLYDEMIPMCSQLIGVARGIAGFGAIWYIASRIWRHIANAESIDFYPLFRPFVLGFCIMIFPSVLGMINGVMKPTVTGTAALLENTNKSIELLLKQKEEAIKKTDQYQMYVGGDNNGDFDKWYKYTHNGESQPILSDPITAIGDDISFMMSKASYNFRNSVKAALSEVLRVLFEAAALCIDTLRTFQLVVLAILGPFVFGIAVFDGFQHTLTSWLARYLNVFLWLPVANIFGAIIAKIQEQMIKLDLSQIGSTGDTFFSSTDIAYIVFMIIGIVGYFTVPSVSNFIVNVGGGGALGQKMTSMMSSSVSNVTGRAGQGISNMVDLPNSFNEGLSGKESGSGIAGAVGRATGNAGSYMADKIKGGNS